MYQSSPSPVLQDPSLLSRVELTWIQAGTMWGYSSRVVPGITQAKAEFKFSIQSARVNLKQL